MAYTIPNDSDPAYYDTEFQSRPFAADYDILQAAIAGRNGVIGGGCAVTADSPVSMNVEVASGSVAINGTLVNVTGAELALDPADATDPRFDLIFAKSDGTVDSIAGNPDQSPLLPTPPANAVALASVFVFDAANTVQTNQIVDKRIAVTDPTLPTAGWTTAAATADVTRSSTATLTGNIDPTLQLTLAANTKYRVRIFAAFKQNVASNNVKVGLSGPASPVFFLGSGPLTQNIPPSTALATVSGASLYASTYDLVTGVQFLLPGLNYRATIDMHFIIHNGATAGAFGLYWCQATSSANSITRMAGSYIEYRTV